MITHKTKWLLVGLVCLALWPVHAFAQGGQWNTLNAAGIEAYQRGDYAEAEKQWSAALKEAEGFGPQDPRLATSLNDLAGLYHDQGRYAEAEPLYKRSQAIWEKTLGPEHPHVATNLMNYAALLRKTGRSAEATRMEARAKAIRARHAEQNPAN